MPNISNPDFCRHCKAEIEPFWHRALGRLWLHPHNGSIWCEFTKESKSAVPARKTQRKVKAHA
jgi:hypothetical protein